MYVAVIGIAGKSDIITATLNQLNEPLQNNFDKNRVNKEIEAQVLISQAFDTERRTYRSEMAQKEQELRDKAKEAEKRGDMVTHDALIDKADKQQHDMVLFDSITSAIYGPNSNGVTGYIAKAVAPELSYQIGQYFKGNGTEGSAPHILAHGILAAAVSYTTGNDPTTGALSAMSAEKSAPMLTKFLFNIDKPNELTAAQKQTLSSIISLAGVGMGATTGDVASAVNGGEVAKVAVEENTLLKQLYFGATNLTAALSIGIFSNPKKTLYPNISTIATTFQLNLMDTNKVNSSLDESLTGEGSVSNAYRHALWQAIITNKFGSDIATKAGDAHEDNITHKNSSDYLNNKFFTMQKADEVIDQLNNQIGRNIAKHYPNLDNKEYALKVLDYYFHNGLYVAHKEKNDKLSIRSYTIPKDFYQNAIKIMKELDNTGAGKTIQDARHKLMKEMLENIKK